MNGNNYVEVVLTGGPSAGKSTAIPKLVKYYSERDIRVIAAPELPTILMSSGLSDFPALRATDNEVYNKLQATMISMQNAARKHYQELAASLAPEKVIIVYDRAECDFRAYMESDLFWEVVKEHGLTIQDVRDSYDLVVHMVTAADGAREHYSTENNSVRYETADQAVVADKRTLKAWLGHPHLKIVDNSTDFENKISRVIEHIDAILGEDYREYERRFLLAEAPDLSSPLLTEAKAISIEQIYLLSDPGEEIRVRKWADSDERVSYFWTRKRPLEGGGREEREALIKRSEYMHLLDQADPQRKPLQKIRYCFAHQGRHCELDQISHNNQQLWVLEVELNSLDEEFTLPEELKIAREVTDDPDYSNKELAKQA